MPTPAAPHDEISIDLHGLTVADARARLQAELRGAFARRVKRVVVVHGVGNHSEAGVSPLAREIREYLKALHDTPSSAIRRLQFGEEAAELGHNPGCVRVWLSLDLARDRVAFEPKPSGRSAPRAVDRKKLARRAGEAPIPNEDARVREAEEELRKRFGTPGLDAPHRPPSQKRGEWPGQG